jgi:hypothetical protein
MHARARTESALAHRRDRGTASRRSAAGRAVNNLDPRERKSYEKAYKHLKKEGKLELYAK